MPAPDADRIVELLRSGDGRMTSARRTVVEAIVESGRHHFTAPEVIDAVQRRSPGFPESTVYRTIDRLMELGVLTALPVSPGTTTLHLATEQHHHLVCRSCGSVSEADADLLDDVAMRLATRGSFLDRPSAATLHGVCSICRSRDSAARTNTG